MSTGDVQRKLITAPTTEHADEARSGSLESAAPVKKE